MIKQKSIYLSILHQGEINTELVKVINMMIGEQSYKIHLNYSGIKPITNNRNTLVQKFLATDCDYLMMIDDDIVPPPNILRLVDFDKDIITPFMFTQQKGRLLPIFLKRNADGIYDMDDYINKVGLQEVDATGTGCIIIKREVLEKVKHPFENQYDQDGIKTSGNDYHFCEMAKELGFKIWVHLDYVASHYSTVDLRDLFYGEMAKYKTEKELHQIKDYLTLNNPQLLTKILFSIANTKNKENVL